jgi:tape measure domain-containing protein
MSRMSLDTAIRLSAEVKGGGNITKVQQSLQELGKSSQVSARQIDKLYTETQKLSTASNGSVNALRLQKTALEALQRSVDPTSRRFALLSQDIARVNTSLKQIDNTAAGLSLAAALSTSTTAAAAGMVSFGGFTASTHSVAAALGRMGVSGSRASEMLRSLQGDTAGTVVTTQKLNLALNQAFASTPERAAAQINTMRQALAQLKIGSEDYLKSLTRINEAEAVNQARSGRAAVIAANRAYSGPTMTSGYGSNERLPSLPNTMAADMQRVSELTARVSNLDRATDEYRRSLQELEVVQRRLNNRPQERRSGARVAIGSATGVLAMGGGPMSAVGAVGGSLAASGGAAGLLAAGGITVAAGVGALAAQVGVDAETAQVRLKALTDQFGEYSKAQAAAMRVSKALRISQIEASDGFSKLYAALRPTGITLQEIEDAFIGFTAAARVSGATAQESSAALLQLKQALGSGVLQGDELRSIREQAPAVGQAIAKEMGVTIGELKKLGSEGKITTEIVIRALAKLRGEKLGQLQAQFSTSAQAMKDLQVATEDFGRTIARVFGPTAVGLVNGLTEAVKRLNDITVAFRSPTAATAREIISGGRMPGGALPQSVLMNGAGELFKGTSGAGGVGMTGLRKEAEQLAKMRRQPVDDVLFELMQNRLSRMNSPQTAGSTDQQEARAAAAMERQTAAARAAAAGAAAGGGGGGGGAKPSKLNQAEINRRALLATIRFAEGTLGPDGYGTHFGGSYTPPGGAHPNKVIRKGGYASAAYGAYQFMPDTWRGVGGGNMTPARQDEAALRLARNRGVDPGQPLNRGMIDKLAPEWASFPTLKTGTSYYGQGGKSFAEIEKFYRQQVQKGGGDVASLDLEAGKARADAAERLREQLKATESINVALKDRLAIAQTTEPVARQMLEYDIKQNELARKYEQLKSAAGPDELILLDANLIIEQRIEQIEHEEKLNSLLAERATLMADIAAQAAMPTVYNELETQEAALQAVLDKYPAIGAAADAASTLATSGVSEMIAGTKDAKEVFVDFLSSIADALMDTAKQMIAQYIAIGIARMFAGMGGSVATDAGGWATSFATPQAGIGTGFNFNAGAMTGGTPWSFAGGGYTGNAPRAGGVDGQGGFPAILHPRETVIDHTRAISRQGSATMASAPVNVTVNVDASGNSQVSGDQNQGAQLGRVIAGAVQQELVRQKRPGGLLAS